MSLEAAFPVLYTVSGSSLRIACLGADPAADRPSLLFQIELLDESGQVRDLVMQAVVVQWLEVRDGAELAGRVLDRLRSFPSIADYTVFPAQLLAPPYRPLDDIADADAYAIYDRLKAQAHAVDFEWRFERLNVWPVAARTVYFLVLADSQLGSAGFQVYLAQAPYDEILGVLEALDTAAVTRLATLRRQSIALCAEDRRAEFLAEADEDWLDRLQRAYQLEDGHRGLESDGRPDPRVWKRIDSHVEGGTWWLVREELGPALDRYVHEHRAELM